jgi:hypothetical protein
LSRNRFWKFNFKKPLPSSLLDWVKKQPEEEKARLRKFIKREK